MWPDLSGDFCENINRYRSSLHRFPLLLINPGFSSGLIKYALSLDEILSSPYFELTSTVII